MSLAWQQTRSCVAAGAYARASSLVTKPSERASRSPQQPEASPQTSHQSIRPVFAEQAKLNERKTVQTKNRHTAKRDSVRRFRMR